jgi:hypothetical protein
MEMVINPAIFLQSLTAQVRRTLSRLMVAKSLGKSASHLSG